MFHETYEPLTGNLTTRGGSTFTFENRFPVISDDCMAVGVTEPQMQAQKYKICYFLKDQQHSPWSGVAMAKRQVSKTLSIAPSVYKHVKQLPFPHAEQMTEQPKVLPFSSLQFRALMFCPCYHFASPGWWFLAGLPTKCPSIQPGCQRVASEVLNARSSPELWKFA